MMRALTMRLFHLGLQASQVGEMTTPALATGDLLLVAAGPGALESTASLMRIARTAGARTALLTAEPAAALGALADLVVLMAGAHDGEALERAVQLHHGQRVRGHAGS